MIFHGDCLEHLKTFGANSIDSLVTDPPAGISFMGKDWDSHKGGRKEWIAWMAEVMRECLRVLKPGAHGLVWAIPRTSHWTATALEDAGFEIRDVVTHLFGTGFPKSLDVSKAIDKAAGAEREIGPIDPSRAGRLVNQSGDYETEAGWSAGNRKVTIDPPSTDAARQWQGWGTALKPACEFWILVRKPCSEKTVAANVLEWGTGGLNIDASRIGSDSTRRPLGRKMGGGEYNGRSSDRESLNQVGGSECGRFPANLVLDEEAAEALDEQSLAGGIHSAGTARPKQKHIGDFGISDHGDRQRLADNRFGDSGGASRFFYVAKASKSDRGEGNTHPTVKSTKLMSYLIRLVTPPGGLVLDPFAGSGSTGVAAKAEGFRFVGIEQSAEYVAIANGRL